MTNNKFDFTCAKALTNNSAVSDSYTYLLYSYKYQMIKNVR